MSTKPFAITLSKKKPPPTVSRPKPSLSKKRLHSDSDSEPENIPKATAVTGFDLSTGGAIDASSRPSKQARVIVGPRNRDWRSEIAKRRAGRGKALPHEVERGGRDAEKARREEGKGGSNDGGDGAPKAFGLVLTKKTESTTMDIQEEEITNQAPAIEKTDDERALEALTSASGKPASTHAIIPTSTGKPALRGTGPGSGESDTALFRQDISSRPSVSSLQTYEDVPIDGFGAALLRGMGWKEGQGVGKRKAGVEVRKEKERRPALLGIGAKEGAGVPGVELGVWGKKIRGQKEAYTPVVMRDRRTGEIVREEVVKNGEKEEDWRERRDGKIRGEEEKQDDGERKRRSDKERDSGRDRDRDRDREYNRKERNREDDRKRRDRSRDDDRRRKDRDRDSRRLLEEDKFSTSNSRRRKEKRDRERRRDREAVY
ncbi:MAG: hypothetical protein M1814_001075 [Vezdaea aestivalis]|nr:MAG: hypothetical protein M1814_001075 [Vezdaea aestivalis]